MNSLSLSPCQLSAVSCQLSPVTCHLSPVTCHLSPVYFHLYLSPVNCQLSPITYNLSPVTWHLPLSHSSGQGLSKKILHLAGQCVKRPAMAWRSFWNKMMKIQKQQVKISWSIFFYCGKYWFILVYQGWTGLILLDQGWYWIILSDLGLYQSIRIINFKNCPIMNHSRFFTYWTVNFSFFYQSKNITLWTIQEFSHGPLVHSFCIIDHSWNLTLWIIQECSLFGLFTFLPHLIHVC